jgi:hypothetical protein
MKKNNLYKLIAVISLVVMVSCENDPWEFPDNEFTSVYFPLQSPLRSLILGKYEQADNSNDNQLKFNIGIRVGGMYNNTKNWYADYVLDPSLANNLFNSDNDTMKVLPSSLYTLSPQSRVLIPKGSFVGNIEVQLSHAFLDDPSAYKGVYVIPLRITSTDADSILFGKPNDNVLRDTADIRNNVLWSKAPKHYTLYGIKFINPYHGVYLRRGISTILDLNSGQPKSPSKAYRQSSVEKDELCSFKTIGKTRVEMTGSSRPSPLSVKMILDFTTDGTCTVTQAPGITNVVTGTGKFVSEGDSWGGKKRDVVHLSYRITDTSKNEIHEINDTIVLRDRDVKFETFTVVIKK